MRITRIAVRDFMGYEECDLDLASVTATVVVGENGSGKSTLLDALTWALYDRISRPDIASQDALIRDGAESTRVFVEFTTGSGQYVAVAREKARGKTGTLGLVVDGNPSTTHTQAETRALIGSLVGLTYDALMAGPVMAQETSGAFMRARPAERKDLLVHLFGLDQYEPLHEEAKTRANEHGARVKAAEVMVERAGETMAAEPIINAALAYDADKLAAFSEAQSLASDRIAAHRAEAAGLVGVVEKYAAAKTRLDELASRLSRSEGEVVRLEQAVLADEVKVIAASVPVPEFVRTVDLSHVELADRAFAFARAALDERTALEGRYEQAKDSLTRMREARAMVAGVPCGAAGEFAACQFLRAVPSGDAVLEAESTVQVFAERLVELQPLADDWKRRKLLADDLHAAAAAEHVEEARAAERRTGQASLVAALEQAQASHREMLEATRANVAALAGDLGHARGGVEASVRAMKRRDAVLADFRDAETVYANAKANVDDYATKVAFHKAALLGVERARTDREMWEYDRIKEAGLAEAYRLLAEAFHRDGIPSAILARGIPLIEAEANAVLDGLPGGLSLALRTQREKKGGGMADTLDVVVTANGWEREYGMLSVGQRFRVDLALRLGLSRVLTHQTGGRVETLWLDEPLAALDANGREAVMETLAVLADDFGLLVVVSHHPDFNDRFPGRIEVTMEDGVSTARLIA